MPRTGGESIHPTPISQKARKGDQEAQYRLGVMYEEGKGTPIDYTGAAKWYGKAAQQGHAKAQNYLGILYMKGLGVPWDSNEALRLFSMSADQGYAGAFYNIGLMYFLGEGVAQDSDKAAVPYEPFCGVMGVAPN